MAMQRTLLVAVVALTLVHFGMVLWQNHSRADYLARLESLVARVEAVAVQSP